MKFLTFCRFVGRLRRELDSGVRQALWKVWIGRMEPALRRYRKAARQGELAPPFLFLSITNACNLRCHGCWVVPESATRHLSPEIADALIETGKRRGLFFYSLLGGEPLLYPALWDLLERHRDCYFQLITNGLGITPGVAERFRLLGNVTPLVSLDGFASTNDARRGTGTFARVMEALDHLRRARVFFGVATTICRRNREEVLEDSYITELVRRGAMYLWYYILRPMGDPATASECLQAEEIVAVRRAILALRRRHPILIIDTYWDEKGRAICPAAHGLGFHIGPAGSVEPCPPLSAGCEVLTADGDPLATITGSQFLRDFARFVHERTRGCVIMEYPRELVGFLRAAGAKDFSGGRLFACLEAAPTLPSHHQPGIEIPENSFLYRFLKRRLFFGLAGYG
ncbi:MAG: radical SAM protein [Thermoguttaceae bacterium]|nr:radical SAM protein [Thermoguttaceae bacterium]